MHRYETELRDTMLGMEDLSDREPGVFLIISCFEICMPHIVQHSFFAPTMVPSSKPNYACSCRRAHPVLLSCSTPNNLYCTLCIFHNPIVTIQVTIFNTPENDNLPTSNEVGRFFHQYLLRNLFQKRRTC